MPLWVSALAVVDGIVFVGSWILKGLHVHEFATLLAIIYWVTVWIGVMLAVYGFFPLTRGGESQLRRSVICILFSLVPACIGLVTILGHIGTPVGHVGV
jgi:hypothetical protein